MIEGLKGLKFHHFGLALRDEGDAVTFLEALGYKSGEKIYDPEQDVHVMMLYAKDKPAIEIVLPGRGDNCPLEPILKKHSEMFYHSCYETDDPDMVLNSMEKLGLRVICISERKPAVLFGGRCVSFYKIFGYGIIELLERGKD